MKDITCINAIRIIICTTINTRCDLTYVIGLSSRFMSKLEIVHYTAAKLLLRYLKGTQDLNLCFRKK